ncbi:MAG: NUDIX hydrolase [Fischerella sp.]|nr:NUDIX hydrolase [Fischerella sp.]
MAQSRMVEINRRRVPGWQLENNNLIESAGALIYCRSTNRYLFLLRDKTKHTNTWGLAGGKINKNETVAQGLYREIQEEIGIDFTKQKIIPIEKFTSYNNNFIYHTFLIVVDSEFVPKLNSEHKGYCWVNIKDYPKPLHPGVWKSFNFNTVIDKLSIIELVI